MLPTCAIHSTCYGGSQPLRAQHLRPRPNYALGMVDRKRARGLPVEENERWRAVARQLMTERRWSQTALAEALKVRQPTVSAFLKGRRGAGQDLVRALERLASSSTMAAAVRRGLEEPYPSRRVVVELGRGAGVHESVLLALMAVEPPAERDPGEDWWQAKLVQLVSRQRALGAQVADGER